LFLKPTTSYLLQNQGPILLPLKAQCHYEVELGVVIGSGGKKISKEDAMNHIGGYVLAIDASLSFINS
jgi:acylpyruvate hydrolase